MRWLVGLLLLCCLGCGGVQKAETPKDPASPPSEKGMKLTPPAPTGK